MVTFITNKSLDNDLPTLANICPRKTWLEKFSGTSSTMQTEEEHSGLLLWMDWDCWLGTFWLMSVLWTRRKQRSKQHYRCAPFAPRSDWQLQLVCFIASQTVLVPSRRSNIHTPHSPWYTQYLCMHIHILGRGESIELLGSSLHIGFVSAFWGKEGKCWVYVDSTSPTQPNSSELCRQRDK